MKIKVYNFSAFNDHFLTDWMISVVKSLIIKFPNPSPSSLITVHACVYTLMFQVLLVLPTSLVFDFFWVPIAPHLWKKYQKCIFISSFLIDEYILVFSPMIVTRILSVFTIFNSLHFSLIYT